MTRFVKKILYTLCIVLALALIYDFSKPVKYRYNYSEKIIQSRSKNSNVLFFGSSRVYRHVVPELMDTLNLRFFNMGMPANFPPESYYLIEKYLDELPQINKIKALVVEVAPISSGNVSIIEGHYYLNNKEFIYALANYLERRSIHGIINILGAKFFRIYNSPLIKSKNANKDIGCDGWLPLDAEKDEYPRHTNFVHNKDSLIPYLSQVDYEMQRDENCRIHYKRLIQIKNIAAEKNIQVLFYVSPLSGGNSQVNCLKDQLSQEEIFDYSNLDVYPEFLMEKNMFDSGHLNTTGAILLTKYLKRDLVARLKNSESELL